MRFSTAVNVLMLGVATIVSALPITQSTELERRDDFNVPDMFERDFEEPETVAMYRRTKYHVALHRSDVGTDKEHWAMHFHPQKTDESATWRIVHAVSGGKESHGVLETELQVKGDKKDEVKGYDASRQGDHHLILGKFNNVGEAAKAAESLEGLKCTKHFPGENCVDWTKQAVQHLHANKHISKESHDQFMTIYDAHQADVRAKTNTADNKHAAGHKK